jgi:hypothetical protein
MKIIKIVPGFIFDLLVRRDYDFLAMNLLRMAVWTIILALTFSVLLVGIWERDKAWDIGSFTGFGVASMITTCLIWASPKFPNT